VKSSRRNHLQIGVASIAAFAFTVMPLGIQAATPSELVGSWTVENSTENHELRGVKSLIINADGSAIKDYKSSKFAKKWHLSKGKLVLVDEPGTTPGPAEEFVVDFADPGKRQLRLKNPRSNHPKEIRLVKGD
jgi:hypothetical protein